MQKSSVNEIRERFDNDVERFSNLETGQSATVDATIALELVTQSAVAATPEPKRIVDVGCGAGNFSLRLLQVAPTIEEVMLIDLSEPMLERAQQRILAFAPHVKVQKKQCDIRELSLLSDHFDIIVAAAVLHHLRTPEEWYAVFQNIFQSLTHQGSFWIFDLLKQAHPEVHQVVWQRYADYLVQFKGEDYRDEVFSYIEIEDSPRPLFEQLDLMKQVGFSTIEVLHCNSCFGAFGGIR